MASNAGKALVELNKLSHAANQSLDPEGTHVGVIDVPQQSANDWLLGPIDCVLRLAEGAVEPSSPWEAPCELPPQRSVKLLGRGEAGA